jgi:multiple sugar transport system permease protein
MARLGTLAVVTAAAMATTPLLVVALASLLGPGQYVLPPAPPSFYGFQEAVRLGFLRALWNSALVAALTTALTLALSVTTAYSLTRLGHSPKLLVAVVALVALTRSIPPSSLIVPVYQALYSAHLLDTALGLSLAYQVYTLPMALWILMVFAAEMDREVEWAARVDGAGPVKRLIYVALPMLKNGVAAVAALSVIEVWGEYFYAAVLLNSPHQLTSSVLLGQLISSEYGFEWGVLSAGALLSSILPLLFVTFAARAMTRLGLAK